MSEILKVQGLTKTFGGVTAVNKVDFTVRTGAVHGLIGPNGAGKTTCFNMVVGALRADAGEVHFAGERISGLPSWRIARQGVARTFQNIRVFAELTVGENILAAAISRSRGNYVGSVFATSASRAALAEARRSSLEAAERVGLRDHVAAQARDLPIGLQRRLEIARCLVLAPRLLLLDEPTAGMNSSETAEITKLIMSLKADLTVLLVEHDMSLVMQACDEITVLDQGAVVAGGPPTVIQSDPAVIEAYLGRPQ